MMITARGARLPKVRTALGTSAEVIGAQLVNTCEAQSQLRRESRSRQLPSPQLGKKMTG